MSRQRARLNPADFLEQRTVLQSYLDERLAELREENDNPQMSEIQTAMVRGKIEEVQAMQRMLSRKAPMSAVNNEGGWG